MECVRCACGRMRSRHHIPLKENAWVTHNQLLRTTRMHSMWFELAFHAWENNIGGQPECVRDTRAEYLVRFECVSRGWNSISRHGKRCVWPTCVFEFHIRSTHSKSDTMVLLRFPTTWYACVTRLHLADNARECVGRMRDFLTLFHVDYHAFWPPLMLSQPFAITNTP